MDVRKEQFNWLGLTLTLGGILALALFVDLKSVDTWIERAGIWGPLVFIALKISTIVVAPLSGSPLYPLVGIFFGFWPGILYIAIADLIAVTINFHLARRFGRRFVNKFISGKEEGVLNQIIEHIGSAKGFLQANLTLISMPELVSYAAGLSKLPYWKFILIAGAIGIPGASILVFLGSLIGTEGSGLVKLTPFLGAFIFLVGGYFFMRGMKKKEMDVGV